MGSPPTCCSLLGVGRDGQVFPGLAPPLEPRAYRMGLSIFNGQSLSIVNWFKETQGK